MGNEELRVKILKATANEELKNVDRENYNPDVFSATWDEFVEEVLFLSRESYITKPLYGDDTLISYYGVKVTASGESYVKSLI